jgi:predicted nucleotide-binding protein (sugar kinase/HSP70/actin superfamily)
MKVTFPHMGNIYIPLKCVFEELGVEIIVPPKCSKTTLELGTQHSPELMCIPFKINLGNYIESIQKGADTIFMWRGCDACRIGYYHVLQKEILENLGYRVNMICVEPFYSLPEINHFLNQLKTISNTNNYFKMVTTYAKALKFLNQLDAFENLVNKVRAREIRLGETDKLYTKFENDISQARGFKQSFKILKEAKRELSQIKVDTQKEVLKIGIVGEIYVVLEPFINLNIVKKLGNMGVEVHLAATASEFVNAQIDFLPFIRSHKKVHEKASKPYLNTEIGGHARHTVANTALYGDANFDGVIHLLPFTCMPEIVAQSILPVIEKEKNIPVVKFSLDEMTGEAGYLTRLEAFVDLLTRRKELALNEKSLSMN